MKMVPRPIVYLDYDDVLCETAQALADIAADRFGWHGSFEDITDFDLHTVFGLDRVQAAELMERAHAPDVLLKYRAVPGAVSGTHALRAAGYAIAVVTGRPLDSYGASREWLQAQRMAFDTLLFADKYGRYKSDLVAAHPAAVSLEELVRQPYAFAVEDAPSMVRFLAEHTTIPIALFTRPWNRGRLEAHAAFGSRIVRCAAWPEIIARYA